MCAIFSLLGRPYTAGYCFVFFFPVPYAVIVVGLFCVRPCYRLFFWFGVGNSFFVPPFCGFFLTFVLAATAAVWPAASVRVRPLFRPTAPVGPVHGEPNLLFH